MAKITELPIGAVPGPDTRIVIVQSGVTKQLTIDRLQQAVIIPATETTLGGVKVGEGLSIDETGILSVSGNLDLDLSAVNQDILPVDTGLYSLGSDQYRWNELYLSPEGVTFGTLRLLDDAGTLKLQIGNNTPTVIGVGSTGPTGPTGLAGTTGTDGNDGATGPTGPTGSGIVVQGVETDPNNLPMIGNQPGDLYIIAGIGYVWNGTSWTSVGPVLGPTGEIGPTGATGATGPTGADSTVEGPTGPTGASVTGPTGPQGVAGIPGFQGIQGPTGATGASGLEGSTGPTGEPGPAGGPTGPTGATGASGAVGATGPTGNIGPTGPTGASGTDGADGATGPTGDQGVEGRSITSSIIIASDLVLTFNDLTEETVGRVVGATGPQGPQGVTGPTGNLGPTGPSVTGPTGSAGTSVQIIGSVDTVEELPLLGNNPGDGYLVGINLYVWIIGLDESTYEWILAGQIKGPTGEAGPTGSTGPTGETGPSVTGPTGAQSVVPGPTGPTGNIGPQGTGLTLLGSVATELDLPGYPDSYTGDIGDGYLTADGHLWVWTGASWQDTGEIRGPTGSTGPTGNLGPTGPTGPAAAPTFTRTTINFTTTVSLADGVSEFINLVGFKGYVLYKTFVSDPARIRIYSTADGRANDEPRAFGDPIADPDAGLIYDVMTDEIGGIFIPVFPAVVGYNDVNPANNTIFITVTNMSGGTLSSIEGSILVLPIET